MIFQNFHGVKKITYKKRNENVYSSYTAYLTIETDQEKIEMTLFAKDKDNLEIKKGDKK